MAPKAAYDPTRRRDMNRMFSTELVIRAAIQAVELMPGDPRLAEAVSLLERAWGKVEDFVDGVDAN